MNKYIKPALSRLLIILIALVIFFGISLVLLVKDDYFKDITNSCRILVSEQLYNITLGEENAEGKYTYRIIALDGKVIKSTDKNGYDEISLKNISFDNWYEENNEGLVRYSAPLVIDGKIENIVIFTIPKDDVITLRNDKGHREMYKIAAILIFLSILLVVYRIYRLWNKDVLLPISEMHKSATEILKGNYLEKVSYDYNSEIGKFSHDFENMRDSLRVSGEREEELKIAEKELLACISHDLKTPIANILGYCEGIIDGVVYEEKDVKRYTGIILKKARDLTKLIDDIMELSKAEINQMTIRKEEIYSKEFFTDLLDEVSMDVASSGRKLVKEVEIPNLLINIDKDKITQVINNIISNSIKYTYENGVISIAFKKIDDGLEIRIKDNGVGIVADEIPFVFNKFYRSEKHRNQNIQGSGLGLSIAKYIVEMHNGSIEMISNKDSGTSVIFKIRN
ncbi:ATP-binding protein [Clostridium paraputrificum]|uniref:sensor histidine kinase n=1 Tax=Clostridium paraputrificum TaxID=29363 RepID=UPI003D337BD6